MNAQKRQKKKQNLSNSQPKKIQNAVIGDYHTAPGYMKDNQHITHGYRINFDSPKKIFRSLFMLHNESVNIWSHFLPALIICFFIISFAIMVDHKEIINDFTHYQQKLTQNFDNYTRGLDNLTLIENMKNIKDMTQLQIEQFKRNAINSFNTFASQLTSNIENMKQILDVNLGVKQFQESIKSKFQQNLQKLQLMKNDYQRIIAPALIDQLNCLNNTYLNSIKQRIISFKGQIDSDHYEYLNVLDKSPNPHHVSRWPLLVFLSSAFVCMMSSTLFHLFYPMSSKSYSVFSRFDYAGISLLIAGSSFPTLYYGMYCYLDVAFIYSLITMTLAIGIFALSVFQWMHRPEHSTIKAAIYGGFGLMNIIPLTHLVINDCFFDQGDQFSFVTIVPYYVMMGVSYIFGLYVYTIRCPERHYPGRFNLCGHSHQIWHMMVVSGIIFTYFGSVANLQMRKLHACPVV